MKEAIVGIKPKYEEQTNYKDKLVVTTKVIGFIVLLQYHSFLTTREEADRLLAILIQSSGNPDVLLRPGIAS